MGEAVTEGVVNKRSCQWEELLLKELSLKKLSLKELSTGGDDNGRSCH